MDIRGLEVFLAVADTLHFGRASQGCHLSPSALTRAIQRLEEELDTELFHRDNRSVRLTSSGERLVLYARRVVQDYRDLKSEMKGQKKLSGVLSLYASITAVYSVLPDLVEAYRHRYVDVRLELKTGVAERAVAQVETGEIDIAVAALPERRSGRLEFLPLMTTELVFIANKALTGELQLKSAPLDLGRVPLVVPQSGLSRRRLDSWVKRNQVPTQISTEVAGNEAIIPMVHLGGGVGVVPQLVLDRSPFKNEVVVLSDAPQLDPYIVGLCSSRKNLQRPVVRAFWNLAQSNLASD